MQSDTASAQELLGNAAGAWLSTEFADFPRAMNTAVTLETVASNVGEKSRDGWLTEGRFAIAFAVVLVALFPNVLIGSQSFVFRDFGIFGYPIAFHHRECFWRGEIPLWNHLNNCGIPFLAQWNTLTLYPPSLIYLLLPLPWSLNLFCILHLFLGGMGMFYLALQWTRCRAAAAAAALSFALSGVLTVSLTWPSCIAVLGWLPWVILTAEQGWRLGGNKLWLAVLVGGVQMLAGMPEFILMTWVVIGGLWVLDTPSWTTFQRVLTMVALVACLAAAQLLPFFELLAQSRRQITFDPSSWPMPLNGWANFLAPLLHTRPVPQGVYMSDAQPWLTSYYVAIPALLLAFYAVFCVRHRKVSFFAGFALVALWLAFGKAGYLYQWVLNVCPLLGAMRYPVKFVAATSIAIPILAAFGVAHWFRSPPSEGRAPSSPSPRDWQFLIALAAALILLTAAALLHARLHPTPNADWWGAFVNAAWRVFFLACSAVILLLLRHSAVRSSERQPVWLGLFLAVLTVDSVTHAPPYPTAPAHVFTPGVAPAHMAAMPRPDRARAFMGRSTHDLLYFGMLPNVATDFIGRRVGLFGNLNLLDNIAMVRLCEKCME